MTSMRWTGLTSGLLALLLIAATTALPEPMRPQAAVADDQARLETIEGAFGKVVVNLDRPQLEELWLREPDGDLSNHSVLATEREPLAASQIEGNGESHVDGGYTYIVEANDDDDGETDPHRYESRNSSGHQVSVRRHRPGRVTRIEFQDIGVTNAAGDPAPVLEDWVLRMDHDGELVWNITQRWQRDLAIELSGTPALFLRPFGGYPSGYPDGYAGEVPNVTSTVWHDPERLTGENHYLYQHNDAAFTRVFALAKITTQTFKDRDDWAVYKLFTNFGLKSDIRLAVRADGHLYRRGGHWAMFNEIGAQGSDTLAFARAAGDMNRIDLTIGPVDKYATGQQLAVDLPDEVLDATLRDMYGSLLNGGTVSDNKAFDFGNQSEGVQYAGGVWWRAAAIAAGVPGEGATSSHPFGAGEAIRGHLEHILDSVGPDGLARYGYNGNTWQGLMLDDNLYTIQASRSYYLYSGDLAFVEKYLPTLERMVKFFTDQIDPKDGVFRTPPGSHWYYDLTRYSGYNTYFNVLLFKALQDLADLEEAAGQPVKAGSYRATAVALKDSINEVLWNENAPGGPRYSDWIEIGTDAPGPLRKEYFLDLAQWPAIALGVATPERARKILATADSRLAQLKQDLDYRGNCTLSSLWPQPPTDNLLSSSFFFGRYTNGGCLLVNTYWEVVARARVGDVSGAYERLSRFAKTYDEMAWVGNNAATIEGEMSQGDSSQGSGEPYLSDMVLVPASVVNGVLGITPTLDGLEVTPHLPPGWSKACAQTVYMGVRKTVTINHGKVRIEPAQVGGSCGRRR